MPICERTLWALDLCRCQNNIDDRLNIYRQEGKEERYDFGRGSNRLVVFLILFIHALSAVKYRYRVCQLFPVIILHIPIGSYMGYSFICIVNFLFLLFLSLVETCFQYKTVLTPPADYLESLANMTNSNGTDAGNMTAGKPSMKEEMRKKNEFVASSSSVIYVCVLLPIFLLHKNDNKQRTSTTGR